MQLARSLIMVLCTAGFVGAVGWSIAEAEPVHRVLLAPPLASPSPLDDEALVPPRQWPPDDGLARCPAAPRGAAKSPAPSRSGPTPVDLNSASTDELQRVPGIGPVKAVRIVAWRRRYGPFRRVIDLRRVRGFGRKTVARLAPLVRVDE